jgi:hypothetical protein
MWHIYRYKKLQQFVRDGSLLFGIHQTAFIDTGTGTRCLSSVGFF